MSSPCHVEVILSEKEEVVTKPTDDVGKSEERIQKKQRLVACDGVFMGSELQLNCYQVPYRTLKSESTLFYNIWGKKKSLTLHDGLVVLERKVFTSTEFHGDCIMEFAYMSSPCHVEVILSEKEEVVTKPTDDVGKVKKESKKKQRRILARGDY
ncbi:hypothetical protein WUBG_16602 [Wuchereria bancrofti]|uniref:Uncharacterized protein n=1 Tax=Wuchereria bancrofti TaxID=6293 RepID=J9AEN4_WUCBA|nr:hypothetical protein WUBG_16602 [Wuchereria bancrofti]